MSHCQPPSLPSACQVQLAQPLEGYFATDLLEIDETKKGLNQVPGGWSSESVVHQVALEDIKIPASASFRNTEPNEAMIKRNQSRP